MKPWEKDECRHNDNIHIDTLRGWLQLALIALFACICAGIVYELAQPWGAELIELWSFAP